jgi:hypothetical protein
MATTYTWAVVQMDAYPEADGDTDVVFNVHWTLTGEEAGFSGSVYGAQGVTVDPDAPFTPYADLTEEQVIGWVQDSMGEERVAALEANVTQQINDQVAPPVVTPPLPWGV